MTGKFRLPIFLTCLHSLSCLGICEIALARRRIPRFILSDRKQFLNLIILSQAHALSIVLSVASLQYIEVSFEQALSASTPVFTAIFSVIILQKINPLIVWITLVPVVGGAVLCVQGEHSATRAGIGLVISANVLRALKSCLQELLMKYQSMVSANTSPG